MGAEHVNNPAAKEDAKMNKKAKAKDTGNQKENGMQELAQEEVDQVSGGYCGEIIITMFDQNDPEPGPVGKNNQG